MSQGESRQNEQEAQQVTEAGAAPEAAATTEAAAAAESASQAAPETPAAPSLEQKLAEAEAKAAELQDAFCVPRQMLRTFVAGHRKIFHVRTNLPLKVLPRRWCR